ncbi:MAG: recombinase family protein [Nitrosopumilus sp.]|nr:recombinase family protein [Nitrosopumilus sp.]
MQKIAAIYARVSGDKQKKEVTIASQIEACQNYAKEHNYLVPEPYIISDEGFKGGTYYRPAM